MDALRETFRVLQEVVVKIVPRRMVVIFSFIPKFIILVAVMSRLLATRFAEVGSAWHSSQTPDEMRQLDLELMALVEKSGLPTPALRKLFAVDSKYQVYLQRNKPCPDE